MSDILEEVKRESKDEKTLVLFKKIGPFVIFFMSLILITSVIFSLYERRKEERIFEEGGKYAKAFFAIRDGHLDDAMVMLYPLGMQGKTAYSDLALLNYANISFAQRERYDDGKEAYDALLKKSTNKALIDYAYLSLLINDIYYEKISRSDGIEKLRGYIKDKRVFMLSAMEVLTTLYIADGDYQAARHATYQIKVSPTAASTMKHRAKMMEDYIYKHQAAKVPTNIET